jgi:hypothetical protein
MPLSTLPSVGPSLPAGCTNVKVKNTGADPSSSANKSDVTTLSDDERVYADAPLIDAGSGNTSTVTASFILQGAAPTVTPMNVTSGWICTEVEVEYAVGEYAKGTATYVYIEPED